MCGISGIVSKDFSAISGEAIKTINDLVSHRGPDDEGFFFEGHFALGHRRLAILDLSPDGHQPMSYQEKYVITFNGEIYNYLELRDELMREGYRFSSKTDTEVILCAYDRWGQACVERFNGMWAFCIYDRQKDILFCSRDRFGVKPFYYSETPQRFVFGSEIKQILAGRGGKPVANMQAVRDFLIEGFSDHTRDTFFEGVHALAAGYNLVYSLGANRVDIYRYYELTARAEVRALDKGAASARLLAELNRSVAYRLRSDVKVGSCLSGGLDSSSIASLSAALYHENAGGARFQAIHARTGLEATDESAHARELAAKCEIDLFVIQPSADEFTKAIDTVVYFQEEPFATPSVFMQYFVFRKAKEIGCKVMLDGQGADEILLGYKRYYSAILRALPLRDIIREIFSIKANATLSLRELFGYLVYFSVPRIRILRLRLKFGYIKTKYLLQFPNIWKLNQACRNIQAMQKLEIEGLQLPHLLRYEDRNSMCHSIEARLPFLDYRLVETAFSLNDHFKIRHGWAKHILRIAMDGLVPKTILWRKDKMGFESPTADWIKAARASMVSAIRKSAIVDSLCKGMPDLGRIDDATFWKLYSIAKWEEIYAVRSAPSAEAPGAAAAREPACTVRPV